MEDKDNGTTVWVDVETKESLQYLASYFGRTLVEQLRRMIKAEKERIEMESISRGYDEQ